MSAAVHDVITHANFCEDRLAWRGANFGIFHGLAFSTLALHEEEMICVVRSFPPGSAGGPDGF